MAPNYDAIDPIKTIGTREGPVKAHDYHVLADAARPDDVLYGVRYAGTINNKESYGVFVSLNDPPTRRGDVSGLIHKDNIPDLYTPSDFYIGDDVGVMLHDTKPNGDMAFELVATLDVHSTAVNAFEHDARNSPPPHLAESFNEDRGTATTSDPDAAREEGGMNADMVTEDADAASDGGTTTDTEDTDMPDQVHDTDAQDAQDDDTQDDAYVKVTRDTMEQLVGRLATLETVADRVDRLHDGAADTDELVATLDALGEDIASVDSEAHTTKLRTADLNDAIAALRDELRVNLAVIQRDVDALDPTDMGDTLAETHDAATATLTHTEGLREHLAEVGGEAVDTRQAVDGVDAKVDAMRDHVSHLADAVDAMEPGAAVGGASAPPASGDAWSGRYPAVINLLRQASADGHDIADLSYDMDPSDDTRTITITTHATD